MAEIEKRLAKLNNNNLQSGIGNPLKVPSAPMTALAVGSPEEENDLVMEATKEPELRNWFEKQKEEINNRFKGKEKEVERKKTIQLLTQAMTQLGASMAGQKSGVDLSGLKFIQEDFEKQLDRASARRESEEAGLRTELGSRRRLSQLAESRKQRREERAEDVKFREKKLKADQAAAQVRASGKDHQDFSTRSGDIIRVFKDGTTKTLVTGRAGDIQEQRQRLAEEKQAHAIKERDEPTPKQVEELSGLDETKALLGRIRDKKESEGIDTGPIADVRNKLARVIGLDDPKVSTLRQDLIETLTKKVKNLSGAAASDKERETIMKTLPNLDDNDEQFLAKIDNALDTIDTIKETKISGIEKGGRDVKQFRDMPTVRVKHPDGRTGTIPAEDLSDAIKEGFTEI